MDSTPWLSPIGMLTVEDLFRVLLGSSIPDKSLQESMPPPFPPVPPEKAREEHCTGRSTPQLPSSLDGGEIRVMFTGHQTIPAITNEQLLERTVRFIAGK